MTEWDLHLRSVTTYKAKKRMNSGMTINLVWVNQQANYLLVVCLVDTEDTLNHHSDHKAVVTVINVKCDHGPNSEIDHASERAWHKVDQPIFI